MKMGNALVISLKAELEIVQRKLLRLKRQNSLEGFESEDLSIWTMVDLMTLILVFFIILYADLIPLNSFPPTQLVKADKPHVKVIKKSRIEKKIFFEKKAYFPGIEENIHLAMEGTDIRDYSIKMGENRVVLIIGEKISFPAGQAELLNHIKTPLEKISVFLYQEKAYKIVVSGHTDDTPIHTKRFPSNWELSLGRALSVAKFLMAQDIDPRRISIEGFGQYQPITDNGDPENRQANRRVEISLIRQP
jgi:chemotaxis protein MotB